MTISDYAAWYAAFVATAVLAWDMMKWKRSGPSIKGEAYAGWKSYGIPGTEGESLTFVKVTNIGDRATTLTSWGMYWYPEGVSLRQKGRRKSFIIPGGLAGIGQVPKKIEPGDVWSGVMKETPDYYEMHMTGRIVMGLGFSHMESEVLIDVTKPANPTVETDARKTGARCSG